MRLNYSPGFLFALEGLNRRRSQTAYEVQNEIRALGNFEVTVDCGDIKFLEGAKSDGTRTLCVMFQQGRSDVWFNIIPSRNQVEIFAEKLKPHYEELEKLNNLGRAKFKRLADGGSG